MEQNYTPRSRQTHREQPRFCSKITSLESRKVVSPCGFNKPSSLKSAEAKQTIGNQPLPAGGFHQAVTMGISFIQAVSIVANDSPERSAKVDFFISYTDADKKWAEWIAWVLEEKAGYTTTIQAWDFRPGLNFVELMDQATRNAERTIAVLSEKYLT